jgi:hypothetical protein
MHPDEILADLDRYEKVIAAKHEPTRAAPSVGGGKVRGLDRV